MLEVIRRLNYSLPYQCVSSEKTVPCGQAKKNACLTGIFQSHQSELNSNITSAFAATLVGSSCFKTEQTIKDE